MRGSPDMSRLILTLAISVLLGATTPAAVKAQANLKPDETPRLPMPGETSLVQEDYQFLSAAKALNAAQDRLAELLIQQNPSETVRAVAEDIAADHARIEQELQEVARTLDADPEADLAVPDEGGVGGAASAVTAPQHAPGGSAVAALEALQEAQGSGRFAAEWVGWQLEIHDRLVDLYQTTASQTQRNALAIFSITNLVTIVENREAVRALARQFGLEVEPEGQPPQYGDR